MTLIELIYELAQIGLECRPDGVEVEIHIQEGEKDFCCTDFFVGVDESNLSKTYRERVVVIMGEQNKDVAS